MAGQTKEYFQEYYQTNKDRINARSAAWARDNPERRKEIDNRSTIKGMYGITMEEFDAILASQGGGCAICGVASERNGKRLAVDHDHSCCPGKKSCGKCVRAILCSPCNIGLGLFKEDAELLVKAAKLLAIWREK